MRQRNQVSGDRKLYWGFDSRNYTEVYAKRQYRLRAFRSMLAGKHSLFSFLVTFAHSDF